MTRKRDAGKTRPANPQVSPEERPAQAAGPPEGGDGETGLGSAAPEAPELARLIEDLEQLKHREDELLRAVAELTNANRRRKQEMETSIAYAQESLVRELLPVLDDFERALAAFPEGGEDPVRAGVALVHDRLRRALEREGLESIRPGDEEFDPAQHEAIAHQESPDVPSGRVLQVAQPGYRFRGRVLRPARVVVS